MSDLQNDQFQPSHEQAKLTINVVVKNWEVRDRHIVLFCGIDF